MGLEAQRLVLTEQIDGDDPGIRAVRCAGGVGAGIGDGRYAECFVPAPLIDDLYVNPPRSCTPVEHVAELIASWVQIEDGSSIPAGLELLTTFGGEKTRVELAVQGQSERMGAPMGAKRGAQAGVWWGAAQTYVPRPGKAVLPTGE